MEQVELSNLEIRNLLLETLAYEGDNIDTEGKTFKMYGYQGSQSDLFRLLNGLLIEKGIRSCKDTMYGSAWGCSSHLLYENSNINLSKSEILKVYQEFNNLIVQGIISPGAYGSYGTELPFFHVTSYGMECIKQADILPYDQDGYLKKLQKIKDVNDWVVFYVTEGLRCFNASCINSSMINIGLAGETIAEELTSSFLDFLKKNDTPLSVSFEAELVVSRITIAQKYTKYIEYQKKYLKNNQDVGLSALKPKLDNSSSEIYATFTRLTRNSVSHPNDIIMDRIKVLMFFLSFVDYCELQYDFINYYKLNS
ncbi:MULTISPECIES: hypothetical protein [Lysinibacillus]|nr:hypothetical protein [Lysinibacillus sphaericus]AMO32508.1 hypothetical protein AR327_08735 [Lysinibacillus sphaericus]MBE5084619.1 hypothetical protein [Bacillus thuringiensis]MBG9710939.1 hypothetical protein [Lysinibacillus sphaericus]MBG9741147.1 hypothetical protein [Lysinibacillus sphaericus]